MKQKRIEDYGINIGSLRKGRLNKITDVEGIRVGHTTIDTGENKTGVTVLLPSEENIFDKRFVAASHVINGFGKTAGLVQIDELGSLESIIAFTNTLNVGIVHDAVVEYTLEEARKDDIDLTSFNPLICECNDSFLNNIKNRAVKKEHVFQAIATASRDFQEGDVGAGKGMSCYQLKGGIGSASRIVQLDGRDYTIGGMVLSNFGQMKDLLLGGENLGLEIHRELESKKEEVEGSIITLIATDIPLTSRQLERLCKRVPVGLARTGSYIDNGSGDIALAFSTANIIPREDKGDLMELRAIRDSKMNDLFRAVVEVTEESILNSMITADEVIGYKGNKRSSLKDFI